MQIRDFSLERYFARYEFNAEYLLSTSDCESLPVRELLDMAGEENRERWNDLTLGYTESRGLPSLRSAIASTYQGVSMEDVLSAVPAEGIFLAMNALLEAGDTLVVLEPAYQSLYEIAETLGCRVLRCPLIIREGKWQLDFESLASCLAEHPKLLVVNFPNNPTGFLPSGEEWDRLIQMAQQMGVRIFSDEMYRGLELDRVDPLPSIVEKTEDGVALSGLSKTYGMPGLRAGWLVTHDAALLNRMGSLKDYTTICGCAPAEILSLIVLENAAPIIARNKAIIRGNLALAREFFSEQKDLFTWFDPEGGSTAFPKLLLKIDTMEFAERSVKEKNVMLIPASVFDLNWPHFRVGLGRFSFPEALARFKEFIATL